MGAFAIVAVWAVCGLGVAFVLLHEDREQRRERIARALGYYPPVRAREPGPDTRVSVHADGESSGGEDADPG